MAMRDISLLLKKDWQGDSLSPLLFNLVVDTLTKMLTKAAHSNLIQGLCPAIFP